MGSKHNPLDLSSFSAFTLLVGHLTRKICPRYDLYCVWWDVKPYSINQSIMLPLPMAKRYVGVGAGLWW